MNTIISLKWTTSLNGGNRIGMVVVSVHSRSWLTFLAGPTTLQQPCPNHIDQLLCIYWILLVCEYVLAHSKYGACQMQEWQPTCDIAYLGNYLWGSKNSPGTIWRRKCQLLCHMINWLIYIRRHTLFRVLVTSFFWGLTFVYVSLARPRIASNRNRLYAWNQLLQDDPSI